MRIRPWVLIALSWAVPGFAEVVSYEATSSYPEQEGWERVTYCTPERSLEDGWLVQFVEVGECSPAPGGDRELFRYWLDPFDASPAFFIEFRCRTDGDRSEIPGQAPATLDAGSFGPVHYGFTIARDQVKFFRDALLPVIFLDIAPNTPHTYRLELFGSDLYVWYLDGQVADSGTPEGAFPAHTPMLNWRANAYYLNNTTWLDYIRLGDLPGDGTGDFNSDGLVDETDFYFFEDYFSGSDVDAGPGGQWADMDSDNDVDCDDAKLFRQAWTGAGNPPTLSACLVDPIPTISTWGAVVMALLTLTGGTLVFNSRYHSSFHVTVA